MKAQSEATIQFSGYPLSIVEPKRQDKKNGLKVVKPTSQDPLILMQQNPITHDPKNWDVAWFNGYE